MWSFIDAVRSSMFCMVPPINPSTLEQTEMAGIDVDVLSFLMRKCYQRGSAGKFAEVGLGGRTRKKTR
jgi:hypothetical protein